ERAEFFVPAPAPAAPFPVEAPEPPAPPAPPAELLSIPEVSLEDERHDFRASTVQRKQRELMTRIRFENWQKQDGFLIALIERRKDRQGLPFMLGDGCRLGLSDGRAMNRSVRDIRRKLDAVNRDKNFQVDRKFVFRGELNDSTQLAALAQIVAVEEPA